MPGIQEKSYHYSKNLSLFSLKLQYQLSLSFALYLVNFDFLNSFCNICKQPTRLSLSSISSSLPTTLLTTSNGSPIAANSWSAESGPERLGSSRSPNFPRASLRSSLLSSTIEESNLAPLLPRPHRISVLPLVTWKGSSASSIWRRRKCSGRCRHIPRSSTLSTERGAKATATALAKS